MLKQKNLTNFYHAMLQNIEYLTAKEENTKKYNLYFEVTDFNLSVEGDIVKLQIGYYAAKTALFQSFVKLNVLPSQTNIVFP